MIIKKILFLILFGLSLFVFCTAPHRITAESVYGTVNQADLLLDKIYAVHATSILPDTGYLRAGWAPTMFTSTEKALIPPVRKTLHFALGELTRPVEGIIGWEDCPYAVVTPLRNLLPQLINLNCYDTFIFGDFKLGAETFLILPIEMAHTVKSQATILTYDPNCQTLREAVDELISSKKGWHIEMDGEDREDELHPAYLDGKNVNTPEFFASLKAGRPWLAVGLRFDPLDGEHYRLVQIELSILSIMAQMFFTSSPENIFWQELESSELEKTINDVIEDFTCWSEGMAGFEWPLESRLAYEQLKNGLSKWVGLLRVELQMRKKYGKTLICAPEDFLLACASFFDNPEMLRKFIEHNRELLADYE